MGIPAGTSGTLYKFPSFEAQEGIDTAKKIKEKRRKLLD